MTSTDRCPVCKSTPGAATYSTAPNQVVCSATDCPIVSWRTDTAAPGTTPAGSYLPAEVER